ncbi:MAG TPA: bifunctional hydroxymethylpyrimidine kinase/phosphomethylpyrimidine kinase [Thermoanaerobaculia bacterium]
MTARESRANRPGPPCVVTIAASDSGGGAGVAADLLTFAAHEVFGALVLTAVTAQNTKSVVAIGRVPARMIGKQMDAVFPDLRPAAVKIGMLGDSSQVEAVARGLRRHRARRVVLDPVLISKSGARLLSKRGVQTVKRRLLPLCDLVTPNLPEAEALSGVRIRSLADRWLAAGVIADLGARAVLIKGGHGQGRTVRDLLFDGSTLTVFSARRIRTSPAHGTGCTLSSAIAANLARGSGLHESVELAIAYLRSALETGFFPGSGFAVLDHSPVIRARS